MEGHLAVRCLPIKLKIDEHSSNYWIFKLLLRKALDKWETLLYCRYLFEQGRSLEKINFKLALVVSYATLTGMPLKSFVFFFLIS